MRALVVLISALLTSVGCGPGPAHTTSFVDGAGRSCSVDPAVDGSASCDAPPSAHCASGSHAGYAVAPAVDGILQNCGACLDASGHTTLVDSTTCANVSCADATDCVYDGYDCRTSVCVVHH